jgi:hypothetical protein
MKVWITKEDIDHALGYSPWDFGNNVLYSLCKDHPKHDRADVIIGKILLIGRTYAAAIERRKNAQNTSDDFYTNIVVNEIMNSELDQWLTALPDKMTEPWTQLGIVITLHKQLMNIFSDMTGLNKRSLASKYLHFHRPDLFFLYDSRSRESISKVTPRLDKIKNINAEFQDQEYHSFCRRALHLREFIAKEFGKILTPRQLDKILLRITDKIRKDKAKGARK